MTPFGAKLREIRAERDVTLKTLATALRVSPAYLSALEHGRRGRPSWVMVQDIIGYFNIIWDEAEELQRLALLSHPNISIDTSGLSPKATELANCLGQNIAGFDDETLERLIAVVTRSDPPKE